MRHVTILCCLFFVAGVFAQTRPAPTSLEQDVLGSWQSEDLGLDFPIWMVNTYVADGTVQIEFYSKPRDKEIHHKDKTRYARWRIQNGALEVGKTDDVSAFNREGKPRTIRTDPSGKVISIDGWTRIAPPVTQPTSRPSGER